jgi:hypothetical protein
MKGLQLFKYTEGHYSLIFDRSLSTTNIGGQDEVNGFSAKVEGRQFLHSRGGLLSFY